VHTNRLAGIPKPPIEKRKEANHITRWRVRLPIVHWGMIHSGIFSSEIGQRSSPVNRAMRAALVTLHVGHALAAVMAKARACERRQELGSDNGGGCRSLKAKTVGGRGKRERTKSLLPRLI